MKIISKHKDYYDYLQGIYGIDELMTYDRRTQYLVKPEEIIEEDSYTTYTFAICDSLYTIYRYKEKYYHYSNELVELHNVLIKHGKRGFSMIHGKDMIEKRKIYKKKLNITIKTIVDLLK